MRTAADRLVRPKDQTPHRDVDCGKDGDCDWTGRTNGRTEREETLRL